MSDDEVDELLKAVDTSSGEINYAGMLPKRTEYCKHRADIEYRFGPSRP
jgi:hypothetical protein